MGYHQKSSALFFALLFLSKNFMQASASLVDYGPLTNGITGQPTTADTFLNSLGTANATSLYPIMKKYASYAKTLTVSEQNSLQTNPLLFSGTVQECALLTEAFFVHLGLAFDVKMVTGIDTTATQKINPSVSLQRGLSEDVLKTLKAAETKKPMTTLPAFCVTMFNVARYIRGFGNATFQGTVQTRQTDSTDRFYGAIVLNIAWKEASQSVNTAGKVLTEAGLNVTSFGTNKTFIKNQTAGIAPVARGLDVAKTSDKARILSFLTTDVGGGEATQSVTKPYQVLITKGDTAYQPKIIIQEQNGAISKVEVTPGMEQFLKDSEGYPWAVIVEATNKKVGNEYVPDLEVVGLARLNRHDFPFQYNAPNNSFISGAPFTSKILTEGFLLFKQQIFNVPNFSGTAVKRNLAYGTCKNVIPQITASTNSAENNVYLKPFNAAVAKFNGSLNYDWGTTPSVAIKDALNGCINILKTIGVSQQDLKARYLYNSIAEKKVTNPNIYIIGEQQQQKNNSQVKTQ
jgi:hypothetical protein